MKKVPGSLHFMEHTDYFSFGLSGIDLTHQVHYLYFGARPSAHAYFQLLRLHPLGLNPDWLDKLKGRMYFSPSLEHTHEHYLKVGVNLEPERHSSRGVQQAVVSTDAGCGKQGGGCQNPDACGGAGASPVGSGAAARGGSGQARGSTHWHPVRAACTRPQVVRTTVQPLGHNMQHAIDAYEYIAHHHSYKRDEHPVVKISYNLSPLQVRVVVVAAGCGLLSMAVAVAAPVGLQAAAHPRVRALDAHP